MGVYDKWCGLLLSNLGLSILDRVVRLQQVTRPTVYMGRYKWYPSNLCT